MKDFRGKRVLITGGASGIGKLMGEAALRKGAELIIWDINEQGTVTAVAELSKLGRVMSQIVDISDTKSVMQAAELVKNNGGTPDLLINNAGIVPGNRYFHEHTHDDIDRTMNINALAAMHLTLAFLPDMIARNSGHVCNIASSAGLVSNPRMTVYVASKWATTGWSDSLRIEMQRQKISINVTTVTPYYIDTGMFAGVHSPLVPILKPETAVRKIIRGIEHNRIFVSMPWSMHFVRLCQGLLPIFIFDWIMGDVLRVYNTMENFTGRNKQCHGSNR
ncbi:MAG: SDR family oxidoreductase [Bacteroidales bacterium]|jgi:short-subunit dehydrogenase|nr:SDR family oxidoreductase [Bacteroidales bacterium]